LEGTQNGAATKACNHYKSNSPHNLPNPSTFTSVPLKSQNPKPYPTPPKGEAMVPFYQMAGTEFTEGIVGLGAARIRWGGPCARSCVQLCLAFAVALVFCVCVLRLASAFWRSLRILCACLCPTKPSPPPSPPTPPPQKGRLQARPPTPHPSQTTPPQIPPPTPQKRDLFKRARTAAPCVIFVDELDALGLARASGGEGGAFVWLCGVFGCHSGWRAQAGVRGRFPLC
jgi:hypothetical protein